MEGETSRARVAMVRMGVALVLAAIAGVAYLRPSPTPAAAPARPPAAAGGVQVLGASFADAGRGSVTVARSSTGVYTFLTFDGGRSWRAFDQPVRFEGAGVTLAWPAGPSPAAGGPRVSHDGGRTWRPFALPDSNGVFTGPSAFLDARHAWLLVHPRGILPALDSSAALWRTDDGGATWRRLAGTGLAGGAVRQPVFIDPLRGVLPTLRPPGLLEVLATEDGGESWRPILRMSSPWPASGIVDAWAFAIGRRLILSLASAAADGTDRGRPTEHVTTVASQDGGRTWGAPAAGPDLVPRYASPPVVDAGNRLLLLDGRRLWISEDAGASWTARLVQAPADVEPEQLLAAAPGALFAAASLTGSTADLSAALLRSTDGGVHWERVRLPAAAGIDAQAVELRPTRRVSGHR